MGRLRTVWAKLKGQAVQSREDDAFTEEIREHIALLTQHFRARGMSAEDVTDYDASGNQISVGCFTHAAQRPSSLGD